jgi:hypothetical protein
MRYKREIITMTSFQANLQTIQTFTDTIAKKGREKAYLRLVRDGDHARLQLAKTKPFFHSQDYNLQNIVRYILSMPLPPSLDDKQRGKLQDFAGVIQNKIKSYNSKWFRKIFFFLKMDESFLTKFQNNIAPACFKGAQQKQPPIDPKTARKQIVDLSKKSALNLKQIHTAIQTTKAEDIVVLYQDILSQILHNTQSAQLSKNPTKQAEKPHFVVRQDGDGNCLFHTFSYGIRLRWEDLKGKLDPSIKPALDGIYTTRELRKIAHNYLSQVLSRKDHDAEKDHIRSLLDLAIEDQNKGPRNEMRQCLRTSCEEIIRLLKRSPKKFQALIKQGDALKQADKQGRAWAKGSDGAIQNFIDAANGEIQKAKIKNRTKKQADKIIHRLNQVRQEEEPKIIQPGHYNDYVNKVQKNGFFASFPEIYALSRVFGMNVKITLNADSHYPQDVDWSEYFPPLQADKLLVEEPIHLDFEGGNHFNYVVGRNVF